MFKYLTKNVLETNKKSKGMQNPKPRVAQIISPRKSFSCKSKILSIRQTNITFLHWQIGQPFESSTLPNGYAIIQTGGQPEMHPAGTLVTGW